MPKMTEHALPSFRASAARLIAPQSYFLDRFVPDCEEIHLPAKEVAGGYLRYGLGVYDAAQEHKPKKLLDRLSTRRHHRPDGQLIDLRRNAPQNFAHFLNNHLPLVFFLQGALRLEWEEIVLLLPADTPRYILEAADLFGFKTLCTNDPVSGEGVLFEVAPWTAVRPSRVNWARLPAVTERLKAALVGDGALPRRVFMSRRKTRALANEAEIETFLAARGFEKVYPEDLPVADQIRLFREAEEIVAIHGAGLAPLLYVPPGASLRRLIEILPCGHMTDVYRVMSQQVGCDWIGVRGKIKPEYVRPAYDLSAPFKAFSLDAFEVDLTALARAFDFV